MSIELIKAVDCSTIKHSCARIKKKTQREIGHAIKNGDIHIPEGDKRYSCKYYDRENKLYLAYKKRSCCRCTINRVVKDNSYGWAHTQE